MGHAGRVAALRVLDDLTADALAPNRQLLDRRRAEGVTCGHHYFLAVRLEALGQLGDAGRLAGAVDAGHQDHRRPGRVPVEVGPLGRQHLFQLLLDVDFHVAGDFLVEKRLANAVHDFGRGADADVGEVKALFQLSKEVFIDFAAQAEQRGDAREDAARSGETLLDLVEDSAENHVRRPNSV